MPFNVELPNYKSEVIGVMTYQLVLTGRFKKGLRRAKKLGLACLSVRLFLKSTLSARVSYDEYSDAKRKFRDFRGDNTLDTRQFQVALRHLRQFSGLVDLPPTEFDVDNTDCNEFDPLFLTYHNKFLHEVEGLEQYRDVEYVIPFFVGGFWHMLQNWVSHKLVNSFQGFLGFTDGLHRYRKTYSIIAAPMNVYFPFMCVDYSFRNG